VGQADTKEQTESAGQNSMQEESNDAHQFLTFQLADEVYAIDILHVREIIDYADPTVVPMMPKFIAGVINLRGSVVPVIDLAKRFGEQPTAITKRTSVVVIELENNGHPLEIGVIVDLVNEVLDIDDENIEPAPSFGASIRTDFISGMGNVGGKFLIILNVDKVLSLAELSVVEQVQSREEICKD